MKKILSILFFILLFPQLTLALEDEIVLPDNDVKIEKNYEENEIPVIYEEPIVLENEAKSPLKAIIEKDYDIKSSDGMLKDYLKSDFERGPLKQIGAQFSYQGNFTEKFGDDFKYNPALLNIGIKGKFRSEKEGFNTLFDVTPMHQNFFHRLVLDAWIETKRIPNHTLMFGTSRPNVGVEGGQSPYTLPFISRTQTARNFGNIRKTGLRLKGDYKYVDYDLGGYSSDTWYSEFFPGVETDLWLNFKPLAKAEGKYGNLNLGGGFQAGNRNSVDFTVESAALGYEYKNFWMRSELQNANGSNGAGGLTDKKAWGYNVTLAYRLTKKLELLFRYDDFDPDKNISNNNIKEYTIGTNYYLLGQCARIIVNYVFSKNQSAHDSHKIIVGTQFLL